MSAHPFLKIVRDPAEAVAFQSIEQAALAVADVVRVPSNEGATVLNGYRIEILPMPSRHGVLVAVFWPNDAAPYYFAQRL